MTILYIETSTTVCSVALSHNGQLLFSKQNAEGMNHAELLSPFIAEAMKKLEEKGLTLDAVAVSAGPGSYTGLRIGVSTAKGLCYGLDIPMIAIDTLELIARRAIDTIGKSNALYCPMIDARRMEVYTALYDGKLSVVEPASAKIISSDSYSQIHENKQVFFIGNGAPKCKEMIQNENAIFIDDIHPLASNMIPLAEKKYANKEFVDVAYFEPFYLKEFYTSSPL
jgi:tRNA threonylcarbamoyladenosine biosynthesis protein TsaB